MLVTLFTSAVALKISADEIDEPLKEMLVDDGLEVIDEHFEERRRYGHDCGSIMTMSTCLNAHSHSCQWVGTEYNGFCQDEGGDPWDNMCSGLDEYQCKGNYDCVWDMGYGFTPGTCYNKAVPYGMAESAPTRGSTGTQPPMTGMMGMSPQMMMPMGGVNNLPMGCNSMLTMPACNASPQCVWHMNSCEMETPHPCTVLKTDAHCSQFHSHCYWSAMNGMCNGYQTQSPKKNMMGSSKGPSSMGSKYYWAMRNGHPVLVPHGDSSATMDVPAMTSSSNMAEASPSRFSSPNNVFVPAGTVGGAVAGTAIGATTGIAGSSIAGAAVGGPVGALVGAGIGATTALVGEEIQQQQNTEAMQCYGAYYESACKGLPSYCYWESGTCKYFPSLG